MLCNSEQWFICAEQQRPVWIQILATINVQPPPQPSLVRQRGPAKDSDNRASKPRTVAFATLGCKVNTFETEQIAQRLGDRAYQRVGNTGLADLHIINTCTVTAEADRQARQQVRKIIRKNPQAWIVVTGCYAQMDPDACAAIPGVDLVVGNSQKLDIPDLLEDLYEGKLPPIMLRDIDKEISLPDQLLQGFEGRSRAFVQIQQGCDQGCTFCIIHTARGPNRSFSLASIARQCQRLILNGYGEIVLCGVDIGSYGSDLNRGELGDDVELSDLVAHLLTLQGDFRLRLSSIDPIHITDRFIQLMADNPKICPQLHLSLQSASTLILKRMKRRATRQIVYERIQSLRNALPDLVLSADILVGFPTEEESHFDDTLIAIDELEIAYPHVFSYSARQGTPAARIPRQVEKPIRKARADLARKMGQQVWQRVAQRQVGRTLRVLTETTMDCDSGLILARADNYFPVKIKSDGLVLSSTNKVNYEPNGTISENFQTSWQTVKIKGFDDKTLFADVLAQT